MRPEAFLQNLFKITCGISILFVMFACSSCNSDKKGTMYEEFDGVMVFFEPQDTALYRELLPDVFDMPDAPLVQVFVIDYYKMAPWTIKPYLEAAVSLLAQYKGQEAWHCITMPVTTNESRLGGIIYLGFPKVLGDISFQRDAGQYNGTLNADDKAVMNILLNTKGYTVTQTDKKWFKRLTGIPSLNILRGEVINPLPRSEKQTQSLLELSEAYPDVFELNAGKASLAFHPDAAKGYEDWKDDAFRIKPKKIVLSYYFKSKYGFSFGKVDKVGKAQ